MEDTDSETAWFLKYWSHVTGVEGWVLDGDGALVRECIVKEISSSSVAKFDLSQQLHENVSFDFTTINQILSQFREKYIEVQRPTAPYGFIRLNQRLEPSMVQLIRTHEHFLRYAHIMQKYLCFGGAMGDSDDESVENKLRPTDAGYAIAQKFSTESVRLHPSNTQRLVFKWVRDGNSISSISRYTGANGCVICLCNSKIGDEIVVEEDDEHYPFDSDSQGRGHHTHKHALDIDSVTKLLCKYAPAFFEFEEDCALLVSFEFYPNETLKDVFLHMCRRYIPVWQRAANPNKVL
jgi:hypothetical protein